MSLSIDDFLKAFRDTKSNENSLIKIKKEGEWKEFFIKDRRIIHIESSDIREKFSSILVMDKVISQDDLRKAVRSVKGDMYKIDAAIIKMKGLSKIDVYKIFRKQMKYVVFSILKWERFNIEISKFDDSLKFLKYPIYVEDLLMTASRRYVSQNFRQKVLDLFNEYVELKLNVSFEKLRKIPLTKDESNLVGKLSSISKLSDLKNFVKIPDDKIVNIISSFLVSGMISIKRKDIKDYSVSTSNDLVENVEDDFEKDKEELEQRIEGFKNIYEEFKNKNYFEIFNLTPENFNMGKLKKRYIDLIREYHPDKFAKFNSEELNNLLEDLSNYINTAYETLKNDDSRHEYENNLAKFSRSKVSNTEKKDSPGKVAKESFERGKMLVNAQNYAEAVSYLKAAVRIKPENAEYNAYLGYAMSKTSQFKREAEKYLLKAIELAPMQINYYIHLGRLYKEARLYTKALRVFQEGLAWDNSNKIILKEIDEINEKLNKKNKKGFWGGLGKLFDKK